MGNLFDLFILTFSARKKGRSRSRRTRARARVCVCVCVCVGGGVWGGGGGRLGSTHLFALGDPHLGVIAGQTAHGPLLSGYRGPNPNS